VRVPFGAAQVVGVLVERCAVSEIDPKRLKRVSEVLDTVPVLPLEILELARWAAGYYSHPPGEVLATVLPVALRKGLPAPARGERRYRLTGAGRQVDARDLGRAVRQAELLKRLGGHAEGMTGPQLAAVVTHWRQPLNALCKRGWVEVVDGPCLPVAVPGGQTDPPPVLGDEQRRAVQAMEPHLHHFQPALLDGVTGSGKTEVYLRLIARVLEAGRQVLVLVPEIGLTPQLVRRFQRRFPVPIGVLHSGLSDSERLCAWLAARDGQARIVIGTRSAVFTPLARPGLIVIDEEHDSSFKQQDGFRYSARDLAVLRARRLDIPVLLGSATPSLESLRNALEGRYLHLRLPSRAGGGRLPSVQVLDVRRRTMYEGLSDRLLEQMRRHLDAGGQVLLFLNRRGFAPTLICHACGQVAECRRCDAHMTVHLSSRRLRCHHCGSERPLASRCRACGSEQVRTLGAGTERIEAALAELFPDTALVRIDRDSTRRKGAMDEKLASARRGDARILIGTQMLAKGHHFPDVSMVGILDADQGLFGADFRAAERMAQLVVQVAGRAGRAGRPGEVFIQTHHPDHPLLHTLVTRGYHAFAEEALAERRATGLPPFGHLALLRAEAGRREEPQVFLQRARDYAAALLSGGVELWGPAPAPMERRAGRYRAQLLLHARRRSDLHALLQQWLPKLVSDKSARRVRWSIDVDPQDLF